MVRKEALLEQRPIFDTRYSMIEEADLFRRIAYSWKIDGVNFPTAKWRMHSESWTFKHPDSLRVESKLMIEEYKKRYQDFERTFANELLLLEASIFIGEIKQKLYTSSYLKAFGCLVRMMTSKSVLCLPYLLFYFVKKRLHY